jgi:hypothetical protein
MTVPFMFVRSVDFPTLTLGQSVATQVQAAMSWGNATAESSLTFQGLADDPRFERYDVLHQVERDVDAFFRDQQVNRLLLNRRFKAYLNRTEGYWLVSSRQDEARGVFERLRKHHGSVQATMEETDLSRLLNLGSTTGAYFGKLQIDKVRTAAVFGSTTIVESEEWERYAELGELKVLYMRVRGDDGETRSLTLMRNRGVVMMRDQGERLNLGFVASLQASIDTETTKGQP